MKTSSKIAIAALGVSATYVIINKVRKKSMMNKIIKAVAENTDQYGDYQDLEKGNAFDPNYWRTLGNVLVYNQASSDNFANQIKKAKGIPYLTNDDEDAVYSVFEKASTKAHISRIADRFLVLHKQRLYDFLDSFLNASEFNKIKNIVSSKPEFKKA